jgi:hypothetical protein
VIRGFAFCTGHTSDARALRFFFVRISFHN